MALKTTRRLRRHAPTWYGCCVIIARRALIKFSNPVKSGPDEATRRIKGPCLPLEPDSVLKFTRTHVKTESIRVNDKNFNRRILL